MGCSKVIQMKPDSPAINSLEELLINKEVLHHLY